MVKGFRQPAQCDGSRDLHKAVPFSNERVLP
jgi:hypothetical protein